MMTTELLAQFFELSKNDFKAEVFKIIIDTAIYMEKSDVDYLFDQIMQTPPEKLNFEEMNALSEFGKWTRGGSDEF